MTSSGFQATPGWSWPDDVPHSAEGPASATPAGDSQPRHRPKSSTTSMPGWYEPDEEVHQPEQNTQPTGSAQDQPKPRRSYGPRTCRICLETVLPTFNQPSENLPSMFQTEPNVTYESEEGRLITPCKCKGSSRYVHEGCLQSWRHADPSYGRRNYWQCPTCGFRYRLERMAWGRWISSTATQIALTFGIFLLATFFLGFVADPIINLYLDPVGTVVPLGGSSSSYEHLVPEEDEPEGWSFHFVKGFASLGILGFVKYIFVSPIRVYRMGGGPLGGSGRGNTGRDRLANISWGVVLIGIATVLYGVWKAVRAWARRTLEKASERVMDVPVDDDEEDDISEPSATSGQR
ncbi:ring finger domain protein [Diplodia corticola]|uniref:Ring finger domain protein n=1 Tax=Diplodia corticola TaxID=236234 RepID=A0A1J9QWH9_9PEZI|nr:ring finger domain protein [Diplodia corticola]OJD33342.1 ring finger domain protein [Diplodia corticola]